MARWRITKPMHPGSLNVTYKCSTMSPGKPIYFGIKRSKVKVTRHRDNAGVGHCSLLSAGFLWNHSPIGATTATVALCCVDSAREDKENLDDLAIQNVLVGSDGACFWWTRIEQSASYCPMDVSWFSFDTQRCSLNFESWTMNSQEMNISALSPAVDLEKYKSSGEWELAGERFYVVHSTCLMPEMSHSFIIAITLVNLNYKIAWQRPACSPTAAQTCLSNSGSLDQSRGGHRRC